MVGTSTIPFSGKISAPEVLNSNMLTFWNQSFFQGSGEPEGELEAAIVRDFGSVAAMKEKLSASTVAVQVSPLIKSWKSAIITFSRALDGVGLDTTKQLGSSRLLLVQTRSTLIQFQKVFKATR